MRPTEIKLHQNTRILELIYEDGAVHNLPCEYLRVYSPSAEVRGHGPGEEVLQLGKENVGIEGIEPTGNYAITLNFDDGHGSGIYDWGLLRDLGDHYEENWAKYLQRLKEAGYTRRLGSEVI